MVLSNATKRTALIVSIVVLTIAPLIVACIALRRIDWAPVFDLALTEIRVRDVFSAHPPLVGLPGRLGFADHPGSHPGPLSYYILAPAYFMFGRSPWALEVSTAVFNSFAILSSLALAFRLGRLRLVFGVGLIVLILQLGYGTSLLTEPWNPNLPVMWFVTFFVAIWGIFCGRINGFLPAAAFSASVCGQTHIPYVAVCGGMGVAGLAAATLWMLRRVPREASQAPVDRAKLSRTLLLSLLVLTIVWLPPVIDQLKNEPGNAWILANYFLNAPSESLGVVGAVKSVLAHLDAWHIVVDQLAEPGTFNGMRFPRQPDPLRGAVSLGVWLVTAMASLRQTSILLRGLHATVAVGLVVAIFSVSRIFGPLWHYLQFWAWTIGAMMLAAIAGSFVVFLRAIEFTKAWPRIERSLTALVLIAIIGCSGRLMLSAVDTTPSEFEATKQLRKLVADTVDAVLGGTGAATGEGGIYLVTWSDAFHGGAQGFGLVNELDRHGINVGVMPELGREMREHRELTPSRATARIHLATGSWVKRWRRVPGAVEVAFNDPRTPSEKRRSKRLLRLITKSFRRMGRNDLARRFRYDAWGTGMEASIPEHPRAFGAMLDLGGPAAVFIVPVNVGVD